MNRQLLGFAAAILLGSTAVAGAQCCDPCGGQWGIGANALIWQPLRCELDYARTATREPQPDVTNPSEVFSLENTYDWGFKVWGQWEGACLFAKLGYTWFDHSASRSVRRDPPLLTTQYGVAEGEELEFEGIFGNHAAARVGSEYQNVDLRIGSQICCCCCGTLFLFGNLRWVDLEETIDQRIDDPAGDREARRHIRAKFNGAGLGFGVGGAAHLCGDLRLFGDLNFMGIIGSRQTPTSILVSRTDSRVTRFPQSFPAKTCVIPQLDAKVGLAYSYSCDCWTFILEVGYELDYLWNPLMLAIEPPGLPFNSRTFPQFKPSELNFARRCVDAGFAGPFFGGRILF